MAKRIESPSSINTFKQCKRKYYYQYIAKLPVIPNIHQIRGNIAHAALEKFYDTDISSWTPENFSQKCRQTMQALALQAWLQHRPQIKELQLHPDQERFYFEETLLMLSNWATHFIGDLQREMGKADVAAAFQRLTPLREQLFTSQEYAVKGFIDAIHQVGDDIHIIDYKTNSSFDLKDSIKLQLAIYALLYHEKHGKKPSKIGIFFLRHKLKLWSFDDELLDLAKREIALIHAHTSQTEEITDYQKSPGPLCRWSSGQCDFYEVCKPHENGNIKT